MAASMGQEARPNGWVGCLPGARNRAVGGVQQIRERPHGPSPGGEIRGQIF